MICEKNRKLLKEKKLFLFDIDGTLTLGDKLLPGAKELIDCLKRTGKKIFFTTNNSTKSRKDYVDYFAGHNILIEPEEVLTAGGLTLIFCKEHFHNQKIFLIGTPSLKKELEDSGLLITEKYEEDIVCVLVAFDTTLSFQKLEDASRILHDGKVIFLASNPDLCCPTSFGAVPDCGSICEMLKDATGREPKFLGKPYPDIVNQCRKTAGVLEEETVLVGDRIYTDMACAENAGVDGLLVLSGEATEKDAINCGLQIPYVFENVMELYEYLEKDE